MHSTKVESLAMKDSATAKVREVKGRCPRRVSGELKFGRWEGGREVS